MGSKYQRLKARRGANKATVAIAHKLLIIIYQILETKQPFQDLGSDYHLKKKKDYEKKRAINRLERLGFKVQVIEEESA